MKLRLPMLLRNLKNYRMDRIEDLIDQKGLHYGEPDEFFEQLSKVWSGLLGYSLTPSDCAVMMLAFKTVRLKNNGESLDTYLDIKGYLRIVEILNHVAED